MEFSTSWSWAIRLRWSRAEVSFVLRGLRLTGPAADRSDLCEAGCLALRLVLHLRVGAGEHCQMRLIGIDLPDLCGQGVDQIAVVRHQKDRALIRIQYRLQYLLGGNIQVIRGLIEQKEIRIFQGKFRKSQAPAFAAGEHRHLLEGIIAGEQIPADVVTALGGKHAGRRRQDLIQNRVFRIQPLMRLGEIADMQAGTENHLAAQWLKLAQGWSSTTWTCRRRWGQ